MESDLQKLQKFYSNNDSFEKLEASISEFNPFKVLKLNEHEIRHSNVLAWLLDPKENHNLGDYFLKKLLSEFIEKNFGNGNFESQITVFDLRIIKDVKVYREFENIDVFLEIDADSKKIAVIIENKVNAKESKTQLERYFNIVLSRGYTTENILPIFLTLNSDDPIGDTRYGCIGYSQILNILNTLIERKNDVLNNKVFDFISYYINVLEELTMGNEDIKKICKEIYSTHKEAIDLIVEFGQTDKFNEAGDLFKESVGAYSIRCREGRPWFIPSLLFDSLVKGVSNENWADGYPISCWFAKTRDEKIGLVLEIGPFLDSSQRIELMESLEALQGSDFTINSNAKKPNAKYSRIYSAYKKINIDWDDVEAILGEMQKLYEKAEPKIEKLTEICNNFNWDQNTTE